MEVSPKGPSGDSIVDDGVRIVTMLSVQRPNMVACAILFVLVWSSFRLNKLWIIDSNVNV